MTTTGTKPSLYDVDLGLSESRKAMKAEDAVTRTSMNVALDLASAYREQFEGRDLRLVAEVMVTSAASVVGFLESDVDRAMVNCIAFAAVILNDSQTGAQP